MNPPLTTATGLPSQGRLAIQRLMAQVEHLEAELSQLREQIAFHDHRDQALQAMMTRMDEELRLASRLQRDFLPRKLPQIGPLRFAALWRPASYVSGDLYDIMRLDEDHVGLFLCDAVGHGVPAALLTMFIKRALQTKIIETDGYRLLAAGESLQSVNSALVEQHLSQATFATAAYGVINTRTLAVSLASAGHPYPLLLRPNGDLSLVKAEGALLGIFEDEIYGQIEARLEPGDKLILHSDGIDGAFPDPADSTQRFYRELAARASLPAPDMLADLESVLNHCDGSLAPKDDLTLLIAEVA